MQTVISINVLAMILNAQHGNFPKSSSLHLLSVSSAWAVGFLCNYKLLILLLTPVCFSWVCPLFYFNILPYWCSFRSFSSETSSMFIYSFGDSYQKMSFVDNSGL